MILLACVLTLFQVAHDPPAAPGARTRRRRRPRNSRSLRRRLLHVVRSGIQRARRAKKENVAKTIRQSDLPDAEQTFLVFRLLDAEMTPDAFVSLVARGGDGYIEIIGIGQREVYNTARDSVTVTRAGSVTTISMRVEKRSQKPDATGASDNESRTQSPRTPAMTSARPPLPARSPRRTRRRATSPCVPSVTCIGRCPM